MSTEGIFHDAHEVYWVVGGKRTWVATFATKGYATGYINMVDEDSEYAGAVLENDERWELVPV